MSKVKLKDMVVILPGITGSVLQKDRQDLWAVSGQALWQVVRTKGDALQQLKLEKDDPELEVLGDGIQATRLISDAHLVPGLVKIDGYTATANLIRQEFEVIEGNIHEPKPANFFQFPYDWRRDNRVNAKILQRYLDERLKQWQDYTGLKDSKIILLAHSMGGLICRYYLEVLEGWRDCKALFTFGTPFRGSLNAVNFLVNGFQKYLLDLTDVLSSLPSVYQLLPTYKILKLGDEYQKLSEAQVALPFIDKDKLMDAFRFHQEIEDAVDRNSNDAQYRKEFKTIPFVGIEQTTLQSAVYEGGKIKVSQELPVGVDPLLDNGDGTVPYLSAIPPELTKERMTTYIYQRHGSLQNDLKTLQELKDRIKEMQIDFSKVRGPEKITVGGRQAAINITDIHDYYVVGKPVEIRAKLVKPEVETELVNVDRNSAKIQAKIVSIPSRDAVEEVKIEQQGDDWKILAENLSAGLYRIKIEAEMTEVYSPSAVEEIFEVVGEDE